GNIGSTLFRQIREQHGFLLDNNDIEIKVVGISNSRKMLLDSDGIALDGWEEQLQEYGEQAALEVFVSRMKQLNLPNCVFIDNTASELPMQYYEEIFRSNISVVTCNKIASSGRFDRYRLLRDTARRHGVDFFYET